MLNAAVFDLDGTLVDSLELHLRSFLNVCERHGIPVERQFVIDRFGMTVREIFSDILSGSGPGLDIDALSAEKSSEFMKLAPAVRPFPGAFGLLSLLRGGGKLLALATGNKRVDMELILLYSKLPRFDAYVSADDITRGKPAPDVFLKAAEKLGVEPGECVVFEDAVMGLRSAKNAGMRTVAVLTGLARREELERESPDLLVSSLSDVTFNKLESLFL